MSEVRLEHESESVNLVRRIREREALAGQELVNRYQKAVRAVIARIVVDKSEADDVFQETFRKVFEKIQHDKLDDPERLPGFIASIAKYSAIEHIRGIRKRQKAEVNQKDVLLFDLAADQFEQLNQKERVEIIRDLIGELKSERDKILLRRFYINEEDKEQLCAELGLDSDQFNNVLHRARERYKKLFLTRVGKL